MVVSSFIERSMDVFIEINSVVSVLSIKKKKKKKKKKTIIIKTYGILRELFIGT